MRRDKEAEAALSHAIKLSPGVWDVYKDYGMFLMDRARYADAVPILKKVGHCPTSPCVGT